MSKKGELTDVVDGLLKFALISGTITMGLAAPNSIQFLEKPVSNYLRKIDKRKRQRELQKVLRYMKSKGLVEGDYQFGLQLTEKGKERILRTELENLQIFKPKKWDKSWRIVLFDIPEEHKNARDALTRKLKELGFYQLQKSVWIHPFECRQEIESVAAIYEVDKYVTYIETAYIDRQDLLVKKFSLK